MSESYFLLIPQDPSFMPASQTHTPACEALAALLPLAGDITVQCTENITVQVAGESWDGVFCPACGSEAEATWQEAMERSYASGFHERGIQLPCCGHQSTLEQLHYPVNGLPQCSSLGLARFALAAAQPTGAEALTPADWQSVEAVLGCPLRAVWLCL